MKTTLVATILLLARPSETRLRETKDVGEVPEGIQRPSTYTEDGAHSAVNSRNVPDEIVDLEMKAAGDGGLHVKFTSHGKLHKLELTESRHQLDKINLRLVGMSTEDELKVKERLKGIKIMKDGRTGAAVAIRMGVDGKTETSIIEGGVIPFGSTQFDIKQYGTSSSKARIVKRAIKYTPNVLVNNAVPEKVKVKKPAAQSTSATVSATVELVLVVDNALWSQLLCFTLQVDDVTNCTTATILYFAYMTEILDSLYGNMRNDDIKIDVVLTGLVILTTPSTLSNEMENIKVTRNSSSNIDARTAAKTFRDWLGTADGQKVVSQYDYAMLLTGYDLYSRITGKDLVGFSWPRSICDGSNSSSVMEGFGEITLLAMHAARILAFSFGVKHDGDAGSSVDCNDNSHLMSHDINSNKDIWSSRFLFSCCSQRSFYATAKSKDCLTNTHAPTTVPEKVDSKVRRYLPGEVYDADDQCYIARGTAACDQSVYTKTKRNICQTLYCKSPTIPRYCLTRYTGAADGTHCGSDSWCYQGKCVAKGRERAQHQFCDVKGCVDGAGYGCKPTTDEGGHNSGVILRSSLLLIALGILFDQNILN